MLNWSKTYCNIYPNKCTGVHSNTTVVQNINWAILEMPNNNKRMSSAGSAVHLSGVGGRRGGHLCLLILCERDYRCDTFGLGEEHLHKVWREVSRRKTRLMNRGKRSSNLTKPEVGIQLRVGGGERDYFNVTWCAGITLGPICEWKQRNSRLMCRAEVSPVRGWKETL